MSNNIAYHNNASDLVHSVRFIWLDLKG